MNITNNISLQGLQNSQQNVVKSSKEIANPNSNKIEPLIDLKQSEISFKANAKVLETSNEMIGTIIDIKA